MEDTIFNNDILHMKSLVGKNVCIETVDECLHKGTVYVIDPVYKTVVLLNKEERPAVEFVLYHAIKNFNVLSDIRNEELLHEVCVSRQQSEDLKKKKLQLSRWLKHMFINVTDDGEVLKVEDHLIISAPYSKEDCMCDNTIVLERIRNIIDLMPQDFE